MKLTKRGKRVRAIAILLGLVAIYFIVNNIWWTGTNYCWGSIDKCIGGL
jgi:hypothetical protein